MELEKVGEKTYYIKNATNIGVYLESENKVWLIDTGNDKDAGRKILKIIKENNWEVVGIINTHFHADHVGGNKFIQDRVDCKVLASDKEKALIENPNLEPMNLYGGNPFKELKNKFLMAEPTKNVLDLEENLPDRLEYINLPGHSINMIGIKTTPDNIYFLGDALCSKETIDKYNVFFLHDVQKYLETLEILENLKGEKFILSHTEIKDDLKELITVNKNKINEIANLIIEICSEKQTFEEILKRVFEKYSLALNTSQYVLVGSTIKSYLAWLKDNNKLEIIFEDNYMYWKTI